MGTKQKKLGEQTIVITGGSSGIGLATAKMAAERGARVLVASRDEVSLRNAVDAITAAGGRAAYAVADVADFGAVEMIAERAVAEFGAIDTWVNDAGVSIYGRIEDVTLEDARRLFETNYWGVVNGSLVALAHLKANGGTLINVGSVLSDTAMPLQGHYSASKHAVKGFTDALRMELDKDGAPVVVTLIQPAAIDTPYTHHAKSYLASEPTHQPPVYAPEVVAETILACAVKPHRNVLVGGGAKVFTMTEHTTPSLGDRFKEATSFDAQHSGQPPRGEEALHAPSPGSGRVSGGYEGHVMRSSAYTKAKLGPVGALLGVAALGATVALVRGVAKDR